MHSRIYGIVRKNNNELYEEEKEDVLGIAEADLHESMNGVADYVTEDTDLIDDCEWLEQNYSFMFEFTGKTTFRLNKKDIEQYLTEKLNKVKEILKNTNTPTEFIKNSNKIGKELNEEFEFYFVDNYICAETLDNFIKEEYLEEKETEFEIVKTWDYHF